MNKIKCFQYKIADGAVMVSTAGYTANKFVLEKEVLNIVDEARCESLKINTKSKNTLRY